MMAIHGGRERSRPEYADLLAAAGFRLALEIDTQVGVWILEARLVTDQLGRPRA